MKKVILLTAIVMALLISCTKQQATLAPTTSNQILMIRLQVVEASGESGYSQIIILK